MAAYAKKKRYKGNGFFYGTLQLAEDYNFGMIAPFPLHALLRRPLRNRPEVLPIAALPPLTTR